MRRAWTKCEPNAWWYICIWQFLIRRLWNRILVTVSASFGECSRVSAENTNISMSWRSKIQLFTYIYFYSISSITYFYCCELTIFFFIEHRGKKYFVIILSDLSKINFPAKIWKTKIFLFHGRIRRKKYKWIKHCT